MPSTTIKYFDFAHLPAHLQAVSKPIGELANLFEQQLTDNPEKSAGMRKLLEAKDCFVRAALEAPRPVDQHPAPGAAHPGYSMMQPHQQRVVDEYAELDSRLAKLISFFDTPLFSGLADADKELLVSQGEAMQQYSTILLKRILTFAPAAA